MATEFECYAKTMIRFKRKILHSISYSIAMPMELCPHLLKCFTEKVSNHSVKAEKILQWKWSGNGMEIDQKWNGDGTEMERKWKRTHFKRCMYILCKQNGNFILTATVLTHEHVSITYLLTTDMFVSLQLLVCISSVGLWICCIAGCFADEKCCQILVHCTTKILSR